MFFLTTDSILSLSPPFTSKAGGTWWMHGGTADNDEFDKRTVLMIFPPFMAGATSHTFAFPFIIPAFIIMGWLPNLITVVS